MLKGQLDIDIEFMEGTIIFVFLAILIITTLILPIISVHWATSSSENRVDAIEFANIARARLLLEGNTGNGDGDVDYRKLEENKAYGTRRLNLGLNYLLLEELVTGFMWEFEGEHGRNYHEIFTTLSSSFRPLTEKSDVVLEAGKDYIIHIYNAGENTVVDIYGENLCSGTGTATEPSGYRVLGCEEISGLKKTEVKGSRIEDMIDDVMKKDIEEHLVWVAAGETLSLKDVTKGRWDIGENWDCARSESGKVCIRLIGDFIFPLKVRAELAKDEIFSTSLEMGEGEYGGGGSGTGGEW